MIHFDFSENYTLEDEVALLRPLTEEDVPLLKPFHIHEPDTWKYSPKSMESNEQFSNYFKEAVEAKKNKTEYPFIVFDKKTKAYAGSTRFYDIQLANQTLQLGYTWYGKKFQGTGLNKHCKYLLLQFAFEQMGMVRVEFRAHAGNERSIAAMKSIGCTVEGVMRKLVPMDSGGRRDTIVLSILKEEWEKDVKEKLRKKVNT